MRGQAIKTTHNGKEYDSIRKAALDSNTPYVVMHRRHSQEIKAIENKVITNWLRGK